MADYKREALPHDIDPYREEAASNSREEFQKARPYPFLVYTRSKLWDPTLVAARSGSTGTGETQMVNYEFVQGGMAFIHPIRKRQTDANEPGITLGRGTGNDLIVPVSSVSSQHARFFPPGQEPLWTIEDLHSSNGTWHNEDKLGPNAPTAIKDSEYIRLGGNLIAWFVYPGRMWHLLTHPDELKKLTDL